MGQIFLGLTFLLITVRTFAWPIAVRDNDENRTCLQCHGNRPPSPGDSKPKPSLLREQFSMEWNMFEIKSETRPPFSEIIKPDGLIKGATYYDWKKKSMTEIYEEKCIDIFPKGRDFPCQFTSIGDVTYLIRFFPKSKNVKSCCRWSKAAFWAPRPDVLLNMSYQKTMKLSGKKATWFLWDIPLPGPFGYGVYSDGQTPASFWFPTISGWVQQNFYAHRSEMPNPVHFILPEACRGEIAVCE